MRIIVQRAKHGSVTVDDAIVGEIEQGIVCFVGFARDDTETDLEKMVTMLLELCLWPGVDPAEWNQTVVDMNAGILLISQFTLYFRPNGRRADFSHSMGPDNAGPLFEQFTQKMKAAYSSDLVKTGVFQAEMSVSIANDGPITFTLDSRQNN